MTTGGFQLHTTLPLPSKIRQIDGLQVLRAVAVTLVAWLHTCQALTPLSQAGLPNFGVFGIDIFFVISGFIMSTIVLRSQTRSGPKAAWEFMKRRLIRIFPIYWLFALLGAARLLHNRQLFLRNYLPSFFLAPLPQFPRIIDLSWTMMFEMFFYATIAAILLMTVRWAVQVAIAMFCVTSMVGALLSIHISIWAIVFNPILLEFVLGSGIALANHRFGVQRRLGVGLVCLGTGLSFYLRAFPPACATGMDDVLNGHAVTLRVTTWGVAAALIVGGTVFWSPSVTSRIGKLAVVLGNASYSAYLISAFVIEFTLRLLLRLHTAAYPLPLAVEAGFQIDVVLAVLGAGWLSYQFVEWPLVRSFQAKWR